MRPFFFPPDAVTPDEWAYLRRRFPNDDEAEERRARLDVVLTRLVRRGKAADQLHAALHRGIDTWIAHVLSKEPEARDRRKKRAQARKDVARAAASLRQLLPPEARRSFSDDFLLDKRHDLLNPTPSPPRRRGKPWDWKHATEEALKEAGVGVADRQELIRTLGFIDDE